MIGYLLPLYLFHQTPAYSVYPLYSGSSANFTGVDTVLSCNWNKGDNQPTAGTIPCYARDKVNTVELLRKLMDLSLRKDDIIRKGSYFLTLSTDSTGTGKQRYSYIQYTTRNEFLRAANQFLREFHPFRIEGFSELINHSFYNPRRRMWRIDIRGKNNITYALNIWFHDIDASKIEGMTLFNTMKIPSTGQLQ